MLGSDFYKITRLEIFASPVFVPEPDGRLKYSNKAFRTFVKKRFIEDTYKPNMCIVESVRHKNTVKRIEVYSDSKTKAFNVMKLRVFNEYPAICFDDSVGNENFPIIVNDIMYMRLKTFSNSLLIPLFGGAIKRAEQVDFKQDLPGLNEPDEVAASFEIRCICIERVLNYIIKDFKEKNSTVGFRLDADLRTSGSPICNISVFDVSIVTELILMVLFRKSNNRTVKITLNTLEDRCRIAFTIERNESVKNGKLITDEIISEKDGSAEVISSIIDYCELFSWKLICKSGKESFTVALSIPICNYKSIRFENVTDMSFVTEIKKATDVLVDDINSLSADDSYKFN